MQKAYLLRLIISLLWIVQPALLPTAQAHATAPRKPNVIIVITDDQGYGDIGYNGNKLIHTPHLDRFFSQAVRAENFHVSPTCAPTRGALMTGRYTNRVGTWHTIGGRSLLFEDEQLLPELFAANGYATGMFGKWHLGDNYPYRPEDRGFQEVVRHGGGGVTQGPDYWGNDYFDDTYWHNGRPQAYPGYVTDVFFNESLKFIEAHKDEPFFLYLSTNAPHSPLHVPENDYRRYEKENKLLEDQKRFYGMISNIDDNFGRLQQKLAELKLVENTILLFMTDNGTAAGIREKDGRSYGYSAGMRGRKGSEYEGGHRVPFAIQWSNGRLLNDTSISQLLAHIDVLPTLAELANLPSPKGKPLDGRSFASLLRNNNAPWPDRILITDSQRSLNLIKWRRSAVMSRDWRLINGKELYAIREDPGQRSDVAAKHPEVVQNLRKAYEDWWKSLREEGINERYAYIKAGSSRENPVRLSAHDMLIYPISNAWHQHGALQPTAREGVLKLEIVKKGRYRICLRRYPRESGLSFNENIAAGKKTIEIDRPMPASKALNLSSATLYLGDINQTKPIKGETEEISFEGYLSTGKYDMIAYLTDAQGRHYPAFYSYVEWLGE